MNDYFTKSFNHFFLYHSVWLCCYFTYRSLYRLLKIRPNIFCLHFVFPDHHHDRSLQKYIHTQNETGIKKCKIITKQYVSEFYCTIPVDKIVILKYSETKWRTHSNDKISEVISLFVSVRSISVALEGSCQSMGYRSVGEVIIVENYHHGFSFLNLSSYCKKHILP